MWLIKPLATTFLTKLIFIFLLLNASKAFDSVQYLTVIVLVTYGFKTVIKYINQMLQVRWKSKWDFRCKWCETGWCFITNFVCHLC